MVDLVALKEATAKRCCLTHSRLLEVLSYDLETGKFHRKVRTSNAIRIGQEAGWVNRNGYRYIEVCGERFLAHRLAWFFVTGVWPSHEIDHRDCNRDNNRWGNIRQATRVQNSQNATLKPSNTTGYKGVYYDKREDKFVAKIRHNGRRRTLGYFNTPQEAHAIYAETAKTLHGEFARTA